MPGSVDDFLDGYSGPVEEVPICGRPDLIAEHAKLESEIAGARASAGLAGAPAELVDRLAQLESEIDETVMVFRLRGLSYQEWAAMQREHPPTEDGMRYDPETFEPAALAACATDPVLTVEQAERMAGTLPPSEWQALTCAMYRLHGARSSAPKSLLLSVLRRQNGDYSASQPSTESPDPGSLGDPGEQ